MALLDILEFPDPRLRTQAKPVTSVTAKITQLAEDMLETMYAAPGIGLAASQVNVHQRLLVVDVSDAKTEPMVFINPEIIDKEGLIQSD